jgi:hypothetical protein
MTTLLQHAVAEAEKLSAEAQDAIASRLLAEVDSLQATLEQQSGSSAPMPPYEQWSQDFRSWTTGRQSRNPHFDDSRDSIYD